MSKNNYARTLYILYPEGEKLPGIYEEIENFLGYTLPRITPEALLVSGTKDRHKILIFTYHHRISLLPCIHDGYSRQQHYETVVLNVEQRLNTEALLALGNLKGLFYQNDSVQKIIMGLREIIAGRNWLPRHISSQLLHYYRYALHHHNVSAIISLTAREIEILRCLQSGARNTEIADNLFISEYTVKSHLHQIFKKISVKNRAQAISWARQNLQT
ncbi:CsgBAC operon transcriptional regulatory protein [Vibrio aerogenes CECT 7868]|uniref:CsgBAC operon transcriptional regulatory protein n=1 Tax=Vibrio aerogenes CECT 7868 TaxID=1216006 RepID=A0A1M5YN11_9VIBR|nr:LuxR C-terminal-related transcriptional regulator [Vibrio aerogenes]SHI13477.1 CsgBAC operon transcriptional regulatory protein [Vibrio aerogenes CECT 7868]